MAVTRPGVSVGWSVPGVSAALVASADGEGADGAVIVLRTKSTGAQPSGVAA